MSDSGVLVASKCMAFLQQLNLQFPTMRLTQRWILPWPWLAEVWLQVALVRFGLASCTMCMVTVGLAAPARNRV